MKKAIFLYLIFISSCYSQKGQDLWWLRTPENKVYEESYKYIFSEIKDGFLKDQIQDFIDLYIKSKKRGIENIAVLVTEIKNHNKNERTFEITLQAEYFHSISRNSEVQHLFVIDDTVVIIRTFNFPHFFINKRSLFGFLRHKFSRETERLNLEYREYLKKNENAIPVLIESNVHLVPTLRIILNEDIIISRELIID